MGELAQGNETAPARPRVVRFRAILTALLFSLPVAYACANQQIDAIFSLLVAPVSALLILVLLNFPLRHLAPKIALSGTDLLVVFAFLSVVGAASAEWTWVTHSAMHAFPLQQETSPTIKDYFLPNLPDWLILKDAEQVRDMNGGGRDVGYVLSKLPVFFPKYLAWLLLFMFTTVSMLCINSLMRGAWCRTERLAFPLIQLPVAMAEKGGAGAMWRSKAMWIAFAIMFGIDILNGISYLYPSVPNIPIKELINLNTLFKEPPLSNMGYLPISIFPFMAALGVFVPSNLLFSVVVFFLLRKVTHVAFAAYGIPQHTFSGTAISPGPPYFDEQTWGGVLALFVGALWVSRGYLKDVWRDIRTGAGAEDGGVKHRWAFVGLIVTFAGVVWFGVQGDLPAWYMGIYFALMLVFSVVLTRLRAQIGVPTHEFAFFGPNSFMYRFFGTNWITDKQGVWLSQVFIQYNRIHRTHPMPYELEAMKMTMDKRINQKAIFIGILAALAIGFLLGYFFLHVYSYRNGQFYRWGDGENYFRTLQSNRHGPEVVGITMTIFGFAMVLILDALRFKFTGFPLHPAGYVLSMNFGVDYYWFGLLIAMIVKNFVTRYYGLGGYDKLRNVALGILLGEYAAETIWMGIALATNQSTYTISFNERGLGVQ